MIFRLFFLSLMFFTTPAISQDQVKNLSEIVNPPIDYANDGKPLTSAVMSNHYYKGCIEEESLVLSDEERKTLCACSAANMAENLTVEEFKALKSNSIRGRNARGKAVAFGFTPCMEYVIESKINRDCLKSKYINDVIFGKKAMCDCTTNHFKNFLTRDGTHIIMEAIKQEPMSLNPLEYYFRKDAYVNQREHLLRRCRIDIQYQLDRK